MLFKCTLIIIQVMFFIYLRNNILHASEIDRLICKGVLWENSKAHYTEWQVIKLKSKYQIYFQTNNFKKRAKVSSLKHNKEKVIGKGYWDHNREKEVLLSFSYSSANKTFKMTSQNTQIPYYVSRPTDLRLEGKCDGVISS